MFLVLVIVLLFALLALAAVLWGTDSRELRDHEWEPLGS
jgi:nitrogen fixation-related uncharacterized protein